MFQKHSGIELQEGDKNTRAEIKLDIPKERAVEPTLHLNLGKQSWKGWFVNKVVLGERSDVNSMVDRLENRIHTFLKSTFFKKKHVKCNSKFIYLYVHSLYQILGN